MRRMTVTGRARLVVLFTANDLPLEGAAAPTLQSSCMCHHVPSHALSRALSDLT